LNYSLWHGAADIALTISIDVSFFAQPLPQFGWIRANNKVCLASVPIRQRATEGSILSKSRKICRIPDEAIFCGFGRLGRCGGYVEPQRVYIFGLEHRPP
jgi:hypothetical protein